MSLGISIGGTEVTVEESGDVQPLLTVTIQGISISDIPINVSPFTYEQFEADFTTSLLELLYPARPSSAATGKDLIQTFVWYNNLFAVVVIVCKQRKTSVLLSCHC